jgi:hypothetical protein
MQRTAQLRSAALAAATADWGPSLRRTAQALTIAVCAVYTAGLITGQWVHRLNDALAATVAPRPAHDRIVTAAPAASAPLAAASAPAPAATVTPAVAAAIAAVAAPDTTYTVQQLRAMVRDFHGPAFRPGGRRIAQARKADLVFALALA